MHRSRPVRTSQRGIGGLAALVAASSFAAASTSSAQSAAGVGLTGDIPIVVVDHPTNSGQTWFHVRNDALTPTNLLLTAGVFSSQTTQRPLATRTSFATGRDTVGRPFLDTSLSPGAVLPVRMRVANLWEAGESSAELMINGKRHTVRAIHYDVPFGVSIQSPTPDKPRIALKRGTGATFVLKNDDQMTYPVVWRLFVSGERPVREGRATLLPKSTVPISVDPPEEWFDRPFEGLFKRHERAAFLTVQFAPTATNASGGPAKTSAVDLDLAYRSDNTMAVVGNGILFGLLVLGGIVSLVLSLFIPNKLAQIGLSNRLGEVANTTRAISSATESTLRVMLRVERLRLWEAVRSLSALGADTPDRLKQLEKETETLRTRVVLTDELDELKRDVSARRTRTSGMPPTFLKRAVRALDEAGRLLKQNAPTDADIQQAQAAIKTARSHLDTGTREDAEFAKRLASEVKDLRAQFAAVPMATRPKYTELRAKLLDLFEVLADAKLEDPANITPDKYHWIDMSIAKLFILRHYIIRFEASAADAARQALIKKREVPLLKYLQLQDADALDRADRLQKQIEENVFQEDLEQQLEARRIRIRREPLTVYPNTPVRLCLEFFDASFEGRTARRDIRCTWDFGKAVGEEEGWEIVHYFRNDQESTFDVRFNRLDGTPIEESPGEPVMLLGKVDLLPTPKTKGGDRKKVESMRLGLALLLAVLALLAGAREQLLKLDIIPGLVAVFLIGFGADSVKNLFAKR